MDIYKHSTLFGKIHGYTSFVLQEGCIVYYCDYKGRMPHGSERLYFPNFFYTKERALYLCKNEEHISKFKVIHKPILFELSINNLSKLHYDTRVSESDLTLLDLYLKFTNTKDFPDIVPGLGYIDPHQKIGDSYLHREIAKLILKLGFQGWISTDLYKLDLDKSLTFFHNEIMLGCWDNYLEKIE